MEPLVGDGRRRRTSDPRRRRWWAALAVLIGLLLVWLAFVAVSLVQADQRLHAGIAAAGRAKAGLTLADLTAAHGSGLLAAAAADFQAAHADVNSPLVAPFRLVPFVGTQVRSVDALSAAASVVAGSGRSALDAVAVMLARPHATPAARAALVERLAGGLDGLRARVDAVPLGPAHGLVGALRRQRHTFARDLAKVKTVLARADGAARGAAALLGGHHTFLLIAANNAEMRAGSGMALEVGTLRTAGGAVSVGPLQPADALIDRFPGVSPTGDLAARWGFEDPAVDFREVFLSPQFPANAALAARMWAAYTHQPVDGVLMVDVQALADLLEVIGPVSAGGTTLTAGNADHYLLEQQYSGEANIQSEAARHERLGLLAAAAFARLETPGVPLSKVAGALGQAAAGRHLLVWASNPAVEADWAAAGAAGVVGGNDLLLALLNQGANKLDPYQHVAARLSVVAQGDESKVTVAVSVTNNTPSGLTGYAAGGQAGYPPRVYSGAVALDLPSVAGDVSTPGTSRVETAGRDYAAQMVAVPVTVPDHATRTVVIRFAVLGRHGALVVEPSARIPPTAWTASAPGTATARFTDATAHGFTW